VRKRDIDNVHTVRGRRYRDQKSLSRIRLPIDGLRG
jgi:hypothetical protein